MSVIMVGRDAIYEVDDTGAKREISRSFVDTEPQPRDYFWYSKGRMERINLVEFRRRERHLLWYGFFLLLGVAVVVLGVLGIAAWALFAGLP